MASKGEMLNTSIEELERVEGSVESGAGEDESGG